MSETVILITVISSALSSALLSPFLNYLYNSRCHRIKCCCLECDRTIVDDVPQKEHQEPKDQL